MSRKIVAIGGGESASLKSDGTRAPYETAPFDKEIIRLTGKASPHFLLLAHSQKPEGEQSCFETMQYVYRDLYGCEVKNLLAEDLQDSDLVNTLVEWADIIYEGGGDTYSMLALWEQTGFDQILYNAWCAGKVLCGVSAGAMCWFHSGASGSPKLLPNGRDADFADIDCLRFINAYYTPHGDVVGRMDAAKRFTVHKNIVAFSVSNCAAIEIVDDELTVLKSRCREGFEPFVVRSCWQNGVYTESALEDKTYRLSELLQVKSLPSVKT